MQHLAGSKPNLSLCPGVLVTTAKAVLGRGLQEGTGLPVCCTLGGGSPAPLTLRHSGSQVCTTLSAVILILHLIRMLRDLGRERWREIHILY